MMDLSLALSVPTDHPAYVGHFPGQPVLPGVVLLDEALHALAAGQGLDAVAGQLKSAKFPSPVQPGAALSLNYAATEAGIFRFEVLAGDRVAASGVFAFTATGPGGGSP